MRKRICILLAILHLVTVVLIGCTENGTQPDTAAVKPQSAQPTPKQLTPEVFNLHERTVKRVINGNTIELDDGEKVRLIGVGCPETDEPFSKKAEEYTRGAVECKKVLLSYDQVEKDKSGRTLAYVAVIHSSERREKDGGITQITIFSHVLNEEIIKRGYGKVNTKRHFKYIARFLELEKEAREAKRGLWAKESDSKSSDAPGTPPTNIVEVWVYITNTSGKYHREGCSYLTNNKILISLEDAQEQAYKPCPHCKPPE